jgi:hypothetical protein
MTQYAVMIFEGADELPPEVLERTGRSPAGSPSWAARSSRDGAGACGTATSIRGDLLTDGPFLESKEGSPACSCSRRATSITRSRSPS